MDEQLKQSIGYDITQLEAELTRIENEIKFKEEQLDFVKKGTTAVGVTAATVGSVLTKQVLKSTFLGHAALIGSALVGAEKGYDYSQAAQNAEESNIIVLKQERDRIKKIIEDRKRQINGK
jgi:hypothetical protein